MELYHTVGRAYRSQPGDSRVGTSVDCVSARSRDEKPFAMAAEVFAGVSQGERGPAATLARPSARRYATQITQKIGLYRHDFALSKKIFLMIALSHKILLYEIRAAFEGWARVRV